jgi:hypothetical protein
MITNAICRWVLPWLTMYGENPYTSPPMKAAGQRSPHFLSTAKSDSADAAKASLVPTFTAATGPSVSVMGESSRLTNMEEAFISMLAPCGTAMTSVKKGFPPEVSRWGTQLVDHTCVTMSPQVQLPKIWDDDHGTTGKKASAASAA